MTRFKEKFLHTYPSFLIIVVFYLFLRNFFTGFLVYPDFFQIFPAMDDPNGIYNYLSAWNFGFMGSPNLLSLPNYAIFSVFSLIGFYGVVLEEITVVLFLIVAVYFIFRLIGTVTENSWIKFFSALIYLLSPVLFIEIFNGSALFSFYALLPAYLYLGLNAVVFLKYKYVVLFGIVLAIGIFFNPFSIIYILPISFVLLSASFSTDRKFNKILKSLLNIILTFVIAVLLNLTYFFVYLTSPQLSQTLNIVSISQGNLMMQLYSYANPLVGITTLGGSLFPRYSMFYPLDFQLMLLILPIASIFSGLHSKGGEQLRLLKFISGSLVILSFSLIELGHYGYLELLFKKLPFLYVDNYPDSFTSILLLGYALIIPSYLMTKEQNSNEKIERTSRFLTNLSLQDEKNLFKVVYAVVVVILLLIPASSYIEDGNFNQKNINQNTGFPMQWSISAPNSYYGIYTFLEENGGLNHERPLILPYPGFNGGQEFRGFDPYLFNQQYEPQSPNETNLVNLASNQGAYYSTQVANDIVYNSTNMIGVPLGYASVKYIIVDKQLNFTGLPTWYFGSLIGSPIYFFNFLKEQIDLKLIYNSSTFAVFTNLDFKPFVQGYSGMGLIQANPSIVLGEKKLNLSLNSSSINQWSWRSAYGNVLYNHSTNEYITNASIYGNMNIYFGNLTNTLTVIERDDKIPTYLMSREFSANSKTFSFQIVLNGVSKYVSNMFVSIAGYNESGGLIWINSHYPKLDLNNQTLSFTFTPYLINSSTSNFRIFLSLPASLQNNTVKVIYSNPSLIEKPPTQMDSTLLTTVPYRLFSANFSNMSFPLIDQSKIFNASYNISNYANYAVYINENFSVIQNIPNSYFLYNLADYIVPSSYKNLTVIYTPQSLANYSLHSNSNLTINLQNITGHHYANSVGFYGKGHGRVTFSVDSKNKTENISLTINKSNYQMMLKNLTIGNYSVKRISFQGDLTITSLAISLKNAGSMTSLSKNSKNLSVLSESYNYFRFEINNQTRVVYLSQSYSNSWELKLHGQVLKSMPNTLFGNLFILNNNTHSNGSCIVLITYLSQPERNFLISIQFVSWILILSILGYTLIRKKSKNRVTY